MEYLHEHWHFLNAIIILNVFICVFFGALVLWLLESYYFKSYTLGETLEDLKCTQEQDMLRSGMEIREQAFKFISMELHDNISQVLSLAKLNLNRLFKQEDVLQESFLQDAKTYLTKSITDLSSFSKSLDADIILSHGLLKAIQFEIGVWNKHFDDNITLVQEGSPPSFEQYQSLILYRIFQEALNNIIKHAKATEVIVKCISTDDGFLLTLEDNGIGFDLENIYEDKKNNFMSGLKNMKIRATMIKGTLTIHPSSPSGTVLSVYIPLN